MALGPSVEEGKIRYVSASQLERFDTDTYGGCERRWWFKYVARKDEPQRASSKLGVQVHSQIEHYLKTGEDTLGPIARAGIRFLPKPGHDIFVEHGFGENVGGKIRSPLLAAGVPMVGFIDALILRGEWVDDDGITYQEPGVAEVVDWKTTRQIEDKVDEVTGIIKSPGLAKKGEVLACTWQMVAYGELVRREFPDRSAVRLSHGYFQTSAKPYASKRTALVVLDDIKERWGRSGALLERMGWVAGQARVEDVQANYRACSAYGGCPHKAVCPRDPSMVLAHTFKRGETMPSLLNRLKQKPVAPAPSSVGPEVMAEIQKLEAEEQAAIGESILPPDAPAPKVIAEVKAVETLPGVCVSGQQVKLSTKDAVAKKLSCGCGAVLKVKPVELGDGAFYALAPEHEKGQAPVKVKKPVDPQPVVSEASIEAPKSVPTLSSEAGFSLYLDATEDGVVTKRLEPYVEELCRSLEEQYGAADIRCAPQDSPLGFAKWRGALAACARDRPPEPGAYAASTSSELVAIVVDALVLSAVRVVRGHR